VDSNLVEFDNNPVTDNNFSPNISHVGKNGKPLSEREIKRRENKERKRLKHKHSREMTKRRRLAKKEKRKRKKADKISERIFKLPVLSMIVSHVTHPVADFADDALYEVWEYVSEVPTIKEAIEWTAKKIDGEKGKFIGRLVDLLFGELRKNLKKLDMFVTRIKQRTWFRHFDSLDFCWDKFLGLWVYKPLQKVFREELEVYPCARLS